MMDNGQCENCGSVGDRLNGLCVDCARLHAEGEYEREASGGDLEQVFYEGHQYYNRIFYDTSAGEYYDRGSDMYLTLEQMGAFAQLFRV